MPAPTTKKAQKSTDAVPKKPTATASTSPKDALAELKPTTGSGKPDQAAYNKEQETIKKEIEALQARLSAVKDKISLTNKNGPSADRRTTLRAELDSIRGQQATIKASRGKILDQIKVLQENVQKKTKDLQAAKGKTQFRTVAEADAHIKQLEKQVESGSMKLADEKRALQEISTIKRVRRAIESFQSDQESIESDREKIDALRKELDDPESKAISDRFDKIKEELDALKKESDEAFADRNKLFDERNDIQAQLDTLFSRKRESAQAYREANDRYWQKVNDDRARRAEKYKAQKLAEEEAKKKEIADRLLEEAKIPAFQAQIEDCQTLIDFFTSKISGGTVTSTSAPLSSRPDVAGVPKLEVRKVEQDPTLVPRKKKGEEEESYFVGKSKAKGKKGGAKPANDTNGAASSTNLHLPLPTLSALLSLSIPHPTSTADVPRTIEDLKTKKVWFEANQSRVTAENVAKAEADIKRLENGKGAKSGENTDTTPATPAEPTSEVDAGSANGDATEEAEATGPAA